MAELPPEKEKSDQDQDQNIWRQIGRYSHLGFILPVSTLVGLGIGALLDRWLHTKWITLAGLLLGCIAGFYELAREIIRSSKET
jgi:F0F1-type ATP synthase assembly protein I